ncbi:SURF1 family protein [Agromyces intestinalis]|uniref:SURF1-like protein n=1 Tax=Agromyces intestinalis TaxID=2592652 RepID=A0A5C1YKZ3_9MICO|nr:SURF1 family protein [Agromyces intestinalis]QEO15960.1 SURF1 family protein [Agromyces intestinalis]
MSEWAFLRSGRWAGYLALVIVFAIVCCALGTWQLNRRAEALAEVARIDANYDGASMPITDALPDLAAFDVDQRWQKVELSGEYLPGDEVVVRNRPYQGSSGYEVVTPFRLDDGTIFFVDRGWVPQADEGGPAEYAPAPTGHVEQVARLKAGEPRIAGRTTVGDEVATIDLAELSERVGEPSYTGAYGLLVHETSARDHAPVAALRPVRDEGPHLSYALQWFVFALLGFIGLAWAANQERKGLAEASVSVERTERTERATKPAREPRTRSDADIEDEILDRR